jgi:4-amino-4-deoxy-L-arabinose transferase-like glycosyltransferase
LSNENHNCRDNFHHGRISFWAGFAIITLAFAAGAALTWRKWPDLIIDFGQQLYIPWQLSQGAVLYRDIFYMAGGPLSQYWHALLFHLFGPSFLVIIISNFTFTALMLFIIYRQFGRSAGLLCGLTITLAIVSIFCFSQYAGVGNYNYAAPYSHEMLHGLFLSIAAITLLAQWRERKQIFCAATAGLCLGLVVLTKPDICFALTLTIVSAFIFSAKLDRKFLLRSVAVLLAAAAVPLLAFCVFFLRTGSWRDSLGLEFFGWRPLFMKSVVNNPYYQWSLGLDNPFVNIQAIALQTLVVGIAIAICAWAVRRAENFKPSLRRTVPVVIVLLLVLAGWRWNWAEFGAVLPVLSILSVALLWRRLRNSSNDGVIFFPLIWSVFAMLLLAKQGLSPRLAHTGFALAMPALICAIFLLGWELPGFLEERYSVPSRPMRVFAMAILCVAVVSLVQTSLKFYQVKHLPVGHGQDVIVANGPLGYAAEAHTMNDALDWIATNLPPTASLAAIPQGVMLNYLSRHPNSTPCLDWNPVMLDVFGAENMNAELKKHPPDYIALVEWEPYQFEPVDFGSKSYGGDTLAWVRENYTRAALFGSEPLRNGLFGIEILKHTSKTTEAGNAGSNL